MIRVYLLFLLMIVLTACSTTPELPNPKRTMVDDFNFRYVVQGQGRPVVVFESGFAAPMGNWHKVLPEVGKFATAFTYNRRGYAELEGANETTESIAKDVALTAGSLVLDAVAPGVSTAVDVVTTVHGVTTGTDDEAQANAVRPASMIVEDLRALLHQMGMPPSYILVGHSMGGLYSLYYAKTYPREVAGLVLVDSSHPEQVERCREKLGDEKCEGPWFIRMAMKLLPDAVHGEWRGRQAAGREVREAGPFPPIPLVVLTHGRNTSEGKNDSNPFSSSEWLAMQQELVALSPDSRHIVAEDSGHFIQEDDPELVIQAIRDVFDEIQAGRVTGVHSSTTDVTKLVQSPEGKPPL